MSIKRRNPQKARLRRERIRREKHSQRTPPPPPFLEHPFASERAMREIHALVEGHDFQTAEEANARLTELTAGGRLSELAAAWKQDDPKWQAQELAYDALETDDLETALWLVSESLKLDPDCTDANRLMVSLLPAPLENRLQLMREVVAMAERNFGEDFMEKTTGHFWGVISTRPYMRATLHLAELLAETGEAEESRAVYERMLTLNPRDNQGVRYTLMGLYLESKDGEGAASLLTRYEEERVTCSFAWARVMERWLAGNMEEAEAALVRARKVNGFLERYLSGAAAMPREAPGYFSFGSEGEAQGSAHELAGAMKSNPGFREWLRALA